MRAWCLESGVTYQSFWTLTANPHIPGSSTVQAVARDHGKTPAQIFFRFLTQQGIVPLTGTTSTQHMQEDLEIFGFELPGANVDAINRLLC